MKNRIGGYEASSFWFNPEKNSCVKAGRVLPYFVVTAILGSVLNLESAFICWAVGRFSTSYREKIKNRAHSLAIRRVEDDFEWGNVAGWLGNNVAACLHEATQ